MEESKARMMEVNIDEAINITSGTRKYQKIMLLIMMLVPFSASPIIKCNRFYLPQSYDFWFRGSASDEFDILPKDSIQAIAFRTCYFSGVVVACLILPWLADKYVRKLVLKRYLIIGTISTVILALSINMIMMCIAGLLIG